MLGAPASLIGSELPRAIVAGLRPFALPGPILQGVSYVQITVVYIRIIIPADMSIPPTGGLVPIGAGLCSIHPSAWNGDSRKFALTEF